MSKPLTKLEIFALVTLIEEHEEEYPNDLITNKCTKELKEKLMDLFNA